MSERHPIIAITGSSGAGTTSVTRTFEAIFRREGVDAMLIRPELHVHVRQWRRSGSFGRAIAARGKVAAWLSTATASILLR